MIRILTTLLVLMMSGCNQDEKRNSPQEESTALEAAEIRTFNNIESQFVDRRQVDVWLPKGYDPNDQEGYAVLYMQDGQNIFVPKLSYTGIDWGVDEAVTELYAAGKIRKTIVVGVWNTPKRYGEYLPEDASANFPTELSAALDQNNIEVISNDYLKYMVEELKPFIDKEFNTKTDAKNTFVMGSSMGGLISWYALVKYPDVFGGAGCVSTHWPLMGYNNGVDNNEWGRLLIKYFKENFPQASKHSVYFDFGTETLDAYYEPYQNQVDAIMADLGYTKDVDWVTQKFVGANHSEASWRERVRIPLEFLLKE